MNLKDIEKIAHDLFAGKIAKREHVHMDWIVNEMITLHGKVRGPGEEIARFCMRETFYRAAKRVIDKYDHREEGDPRQLPLAGFVHLQSAYTVERKGERVLVPIEDMTSAERLGRAAEYRRGSAGLLAHADELEDYDFKWEQAHNRAK